MAMYVPEIVEEVSENAKMLVEDGGKIVRTVMPKAEENLHYINYDTFNFRLIIDGKIYSAPSNVDVSGTGTNRVFFANMGSDLLKMFTKEFVHNLYYGEDGYYSKIVAYEINSAYVSLIFIGGGEFKAIIIYANELD